MAHKSYKALGYVDRLMENGIEDPVSFYKKEVGTLNKQRKAGLELEKNRQISDEETPEKMLGYFPVKNLLKGQYV